MLPGSNMNASELRRRASVVLLLLVGACASSRRDWRELGTRPIAFQDAWEAVAQTAARHGYPLDDSLSDRGRGEFKSRWRTTTQGFGQTRRRRVVAELKRADVGESLPLGWEIRFHVEQQAVKDMARSLDPREEDWSGDGQDRNLEDIMEAQLKMRFGDRPGQVQVEGVR